jgi:ribosomal protein S18 acetylase RimI-like enzyme
VTIAIRILSPTDEAALQHVAPHIFSKPIDSHLAAEFLHDDRHHMAVALDGNVIVGFASGVLYRHPDKPPELRINEVSVATSHRKHGIGKRVIQALVDVGRVSGCREVRVLTDRSNMAANQLFKSIGRTEALGEIILNSFMLEAK